VGFAGRGRNQNRLSPTASNLLCEPTEKDGREKGRKKLFPEHFKTSKSQINSIFYKRRYFLKFKIDFFLTLKSFKNDPQRKFKFKI